MMESAPSTHTGGYSTEGMEPTYSLRFCSVQKFFRPYVGGRQGTLWMVCLTNSYSMSWPGWPEKQPA